MQFAQQRHVSAIVFPAGFNLSAVIAPRMFFASRHGIPCGRLMSAARGQNEREDKITFSHERGNVADFSLGKMVQGTAWSREGTRFRASKRNCEFMTSASSPWLAARQFGNSRSSMRGVQNA